MNGLTSGRVSAALDGDFVVFLIGMRVNKPLKVRRWLPVFFAMPRMLKELDAHPECGCLGYIQGFGVIVQYWRSFEALEAYARNKDLEHWPAWMAFNKRVGQSRGDVGVWHETYKVRAGEYETIYSGMPPFGLGKAGTLAPASGPRNSASGRLNSASR